MSNIIVHRTRTPIFVIGGPALCYRWTCTLKDNVILVYKTIMVGSLTTPLHDGGKKTSQLYDGGKNKKALNSWIIYM